MEIAEHAETSVKVINLGLAALGNVLPYAAPEIEDGTIAMGTVEALGWLLAELSEVAVSCLVLSAECRQARRQRRKPVEPGQGAVAMKCPKLLQLRS